MKIKFSLVLITVLILNLLLSVPVAAQPAQTEIYVDPIVTQTSTCGTMTFGVRVKNVVDMTAFHLELGFNPTNVEVESVENGGFLGAPTESALFEPTNGDYELTNTTGKILFGVAQQGTNGDPTPRNGDGQLIIVTLKAKAPGDVVPFTIDGAKSILVNWPDAMPIPFIVTGPGVVSTSSCAPTDIALTPGTIENGQPAGTVVGTLTSTDPDSGRSWESFTYNLSAIFDDNDLFAITGDKVSTRFIADYGVRTSYLIHVRSTDAGGKSFIKAFTINVTDGNAPTISALLAKGVSPYLNVTASGATFTVDQGYTVGTIEATMSEPVTVVPGTVVTLAGVPYGTVSVSTDGRTLIVTPYAGNEVAARVGAFTFSIPTGSVKDLAGNPLTTLSITLNVANRAPVAVADTYSMAEDGVLTVAARGVLANDTDFDPSILTAGLVAAPSDGALVLNANGSFTYTPTLNYNGSVSFIYKAYDGSAYSNNATVSILVTPVNDAPVATNQTITTAEDTVFNGTVTGTDVDGDSLNFSKVGSPAHGTVVINADGTFTYTPVANYNGPDSFTFKANDGKTDSAPATVTITVTATNDAPVANAQSVTTAEDTPLAITLGASDVDGDALTYSIVLGPTHGAISGTAPALTYTPAANYHGSDSFTFKAKDDTTDSNVAMVTITVTPVNDAPLADAKTVTTAEDTAVAITLTGSDVDINPLTFAVVDQPQHGLLSGTAPALTYTPAANYNGPDSFTYRANDGTVDSSPATVSITVTAVNDAPVADAKSITTAEDTAFTGSVTASDVEGNSLTYGKVTDPSHGTVVVNANGSFTYTPTANYNGPDSFTFKANDGKLDSAPATVTISVTPTNDAPVANSQSVTTAEDTAVAITLGATDVDGDLLSYSIVTGPAHGSLSGTAPHLIYTPAANYNGPDSFTYKANDGTFDSNIATVTITVSSVNNAPVAQGQTVTTAEDIPVAITLVATDVDGDTLSYTIVSGPTHGTFSGTAPALTYTPDSNYNGPDSFTFKAKDASLDSNIVTVNITVTAVNDAPVADAKTITTAEDTAFTGTVTASDVEGNTLTYSKVTNPSHGTVVVNANGSFTYTPAANYSGPDSFTFKTNDGTVDSNIATVTITVTPVNDAPVANAKSITTPEDTTFTGSVTASDMEGDTLTYSKVGDPSHGTVVVNSDGTFTYTPALNYNGSDSFTFKANDGTVDSNIATVTITVNAVNDAPVANAQSVSTAEDTVLNGAVSGTDVDGDGLTYSKASDPAHGTAVVNPDGTFTYTPAANYHGPDSFTFKANDGKVDSTPANVTITVTAVNDAPVANAQSVSTAEDTPLNGTLSGTDVDGDSLTYTKASDPAHGTVVVNADGTFIYTPAANYNGPDSFTFTVSDGALISTATVTITVTPVNDAPIAMDDFYETNQDTTLVVSTLDGVLKNDIDIDPNVMTAYLLPGTSTGTLTLLPDGSFTYVPAPGFFGTDTFTYQLVTVPSLAAVGEWLDEGLITITVHEVVPPTYFLYIPIIAK